VGIKSREVYEAPAAVVLHAAHRELESLVTARDLIRLKRELGVKYADLVYNGLWFTPMRQAIDAFVATMQAQVTGEVRLRLFKGECRVAGRRSPFALYDHGLATYEKGDRFDHTAAEGFIKLWGLPVETVARQAARLQAAARTAATDEVEGHVDIDVSGAGYARPSVVSDWVGLCSWPISGPAGSPASPTGASSSSDGRWRSTGGWSRTTSAAASPGSKPWRRPGPCRLPTRPRSPMACTACSTRSAATRPSSMARTRTCTPSSSASSSSG
jgi:hypothetical protein